jgi:hypothetical protein
MKAARHRAGLAEIDAARAVLDRKQQAEEASLKQEAS